MEGRIGQEGKATEGKISREGLGGVGGSGWSGRMAKVIRTGIPGWGMTGREVWGEEAAWGSLLGGGSSALGGAAGLYELFLRGLSLYGSGRRSGVEAVKDLVGCVLEPGAGLVELASGLRGQLTELVTVGHMRQCPKNQIRTHDVHLLLWAPTGTCWPRDACASCLLAGARVLQSFN